MMAMAMSKAKNEAESPFPQYSHCMIETMSVSPDSTGGVRVHLWIMHNLKADRWVAKIANHLLASVTARSFPVGQKRTGVIWNMSR
jgi:hypothetical protein